MAYQQGEGPKIGHVRLVFGRNATPAAPQHAQRILQEVWPHLPEVEWHLAVGKGSSAAQDWVVVQRLAVHLDQGLMKPGGRTMMEDVLADFHGADVRQKVVAGQREHRLMVVVCLLG